jgi:hypothetical protein
VFLAGPDSLVPRPLWPLSYFVWDEAKDVRVALKNLVGLLRGSAVTVTEARVRSLVDSLGLSEEVRALRDAACVRGCPQDGACAPQAM